MTGLVVSTFQNLKQIADIEYDIINSQDFIAVIKLLAVVPFMGDWWMAPPQIVFSILKILHAVTKGNKVDESKIYKKEEYTKYRKWHIAGLFFYLISWFIYFARAITAIMDIHIHGISPYD